MAVVEELARAAASALEGGDVVGAMAASRALTVHTRGDSGNWEKRVAISGGKVNVASIAADLVVDEVYAKSSVP